MSLDLYLFRLEPNTDFDAASTLLDDLAAKRVVDPSFDAREAVDALLRLEPRYRRVAVDPASLARLRGVSEDAVRREFDFVSVDGPPAVPLAQFTFSRSYISVSWYSGTTEAQLERYLEELCRITGYAALDPQSGQILRLQANGRLA